MHKRILLFILLVLFGNDVVAQQRLNMAANAINSTGTGTGKMYYANRYDPPRAIAFNEKTVTTAHFLTNINHYFDIPEAFTFKETESNTDHIGMQHRLMQQYYQDIPIEGMGYRVHEKNGFITSANGKAVRKISPDLQTTISEEQAFNLAVKYLNTKDTVFRRGKKLIVSKGFTFMPESFSIAFQFDIDVSFVEGWRISIDARTGQLLNKVSLVNTCFHNEDEEPEPTPPLPYGTGTGMTNYYGTKTIQVEQRGSGSRLVGQTENGGIIGTYDFQNVSELSLLLFYQYHKAYHFSSSDNMYNSAYQKPAVSVQWAAEQTFEYYFKKHNRNSFDNNGTAIKSYVHVGARLDNAFWLGAHNLLAFGDGSNNNPVVELDIVSHEFTHGVTQYEAGLSYSYESGALNESFSDIMGKAIEFHTLGSSATWKLGRHFRDGGLRDMSNPNLRNQPDTYFGDLWYVGYEDKGGVHINSGVQNFWFFLLCEGGTGINDLQYEYTVKPIGIDVAVSIAYRNLTEYLGQFSDHLDSRIGSLLATADLYGKSSTAYTEVANAWDAVGVTDEPNITSVELYDITATTVKVKGTLIPKGNIVTYHFEYGTTPELGSASEIYDYTDKVEGKITELQSETKYYFRLVATNENGNSYASTEFTTISLKPLVQITETVDVTETSAILYGEINPNSLPTSFYFEYGLTPELGLVTSSFPVTVNTEFVDVSAAIGDLMPRQTYYYRLKATNDFASATTASVDFFTAVKPVIHSFAPAAAPIGTEITIVGQHFNSTPEKNLVSFGATLGNVLSASPTEMKVQVPAGASFAPISLLDRESGLTAESVQEFVPTFAEEFRKDDLQLRVGISDVNIYKSLVQDMDGDRKPDIVCTHYQGFTIFLNVNQGGDITDDSFIRNTYPIPNFNSNDLFLIDFDGNGYKDVVVRNENGLRVYPNFSVPGYIFFGTPVELQIGYLDRLSFNDFDLDGHIDIAGINRIAYDHSVLVIFRNQNPKGSLTGNNFVLQHTKDLPYNVYYLTSGDLNNDGTHDLMIGTYGDDFLSILKNNSLSGNFSFEEQLVNDPTRQRYVRYVSHDLNQDDWKDIIANSPVVAASLSIMENKNSSDIKVEIPSVVLSENVTGGVQAGDINGDGKVDLLLGLETRKFSLLENKAEAGGVLSGASFNKIGEYGMPLVNVGSGSVTTLMAINDLNGDGRPEIINAYSYDFGPHDGYEMEIWQNAPANCPDPSIIALDVGRNSAKIVLPSNTTLDQFEIDLARSGYTNWSRTNSTTLTNLSAGNNYQLRVRAKCYLSYSEYAYINFTTECIDINTFSISNIGTNSVWLNASNLSSFEIQYSPAGKNEWVILPQFINPISNLLPGTTYDLRFRGRCNNLAEFTYKQFTTSCPALSTLIITELKYNKAVVNWTSDHTGTGIVEYSEDNVNWLFVDESRTIFPLVPGTEYFVRGRLACTNNNSDFIHTSFTTPCLKISGLSINNVTPVSARINWMDESKTNNYVISYSRTSNGKLTTMETNATSFTLDGLKPGTQYKVAVAPKCNAREEFTSITFSTVCYMPFNLSASSVTPTSAELTWDDNFSALPYVVDYAIADSDNWLTIETTSMNASLTELRPGTEYEAKVHVTCLSETAPFVSMRFETNLYEETTFGPNPTYGDIAIYPSKNLIGHHFSLYESMGRQVNVGTLQHYTIDLSTLPIGIYILKVEGEKPMKIIKH
ncbi:MAG TPA: M4 family metallopeptidase [Ohtaekwangia sp.]|nr:M4 family metallopeptidase [Ohtaekwangia sp.]